MSLPEKVLCILSGGALTSVIWESIALLLEESYRRAIIGGYVRRGGKRE